MIAIVYNGLKRFQKTSNLNHQKMIERMEQGLPPEWDGTYRATSK